MNDQCFSPECFIDCMSVVKQLMSLTLMLLYSIAERHVIHTGGTCSCTTYILAQLGRVPQSFQYVHDEGS